MKQRGLDVFCICIIFVIGSCGVFAYTFLVGFIIVRLALEG